MPSKSRGHTATLLLLAGLCGSGQCIEDLRSAAASEVLLLDVRQLGAKGDGRHDDHAIIASAFAAAARAAAATVVLPAPGVYIVERPLVWNASNSLLSIEKGAVLRWRWDKELRFAEQWGNYETMFVVAPGRGKPMLVNVTMGGGGMIDGAGYMWWPFAYHVRPQVGRPYLFGVSSIRGWTISNLTVLNPPAITFNGPCGCQDVEMAHLNITAAWLTPEEFYSPDHSPIFGQWRRKAPVSAKGVVGFNGTCAHERGGSRIWQDQPELNLCEPANTDGIDPGCGSRNVWIHDVFIENGDDSIVMKPGWGHPRPAGCTRDVVNLSKPRIHPCC